MAWILKFYLIISLFNYKLKATHMIDSTKKLFNKFTVLYRKIQFRHYWNSLDAACYSSRTRTHLLNLIVHLIGLYRFYWILKALLDIVGCDAICIHRVCSRLFTHVTALCPTSPTRYIRCIVIYALQTFHNHVNYCKDQFY